MHILVSAVSSSRQPSGICRHAASLARSLADSREIAKVTLLVGKWQMRYFAEALGLQGSKVQMLSISISPSSLMRNAWYMWGLPKLAKSFSPDIIHLSFPIPFNPGDFGCPVVTSLHDLYPYDLPKNFGGFRGVFNRIFLRQCLRASDAVVCISEFTLARLRIVAPAIAERKAIRIYPQIELGSLTSKKPAIPELEDRPYVLSVAQHRKNKNLDLLLAGFAELLQHGGRSKEMSLLIVGNEGPETTRLRRMAKQRHLRGRVVFRSGVTDQELKWLYTNCLVFIATSSIEGFGLPVAEASQCGARLVCSDIPVFRETAGAAARYFDANAPVPATVLSEALARALGDPPRHGEHRNRFSGDSMAEQHISLYTRLIVREECRNLPDRLSVDAPIRCGRLPG